MTSWTRSDVRKYSETNSPSEEKIPSSTVGRVRCVLCFEIRYGERNRPSSTFPREEKRKSTTYRREQRVQGLKPRRLARCTVVGSCAVEYTTCWFRKALKKIVVRACQRFLCRPYCRPHARAFNVRRTPGSSYGILFLTLRIVPALLSALTF